MTDDKASYIKYRAFDDEHYKMMILSFIREFASVSREDINRLIFDKLSDALDEKQKQHKIKNLIYEMSKKDKSIKNIGSDRHSNWVIPD